MTLFIDFIPDTAINKETIAPANPSNGILSKNIDSIVEAKTTAVVMQSERLSVAVASMATDFIFLPRVLLMTAR